MYSDVMGKGGGARVLSGTSEQGSVFLVIVAVHYDVLERGIWFFVVENKNHFLVIFSIYSDVTGSGAGGGVLRYGSLRHIV